MADGSRGGSGRGRPIPESRRRLATVEVLEGRALLSHLPHARIAVAPVHAHIAQVDLGNIFALPGNTHVRRFNQPGPIKNEFGPGFAVKVPRFYNLYTGPVGAIGDPSGGHLNASGAKARVVGNNLVLTGIVAVAQIPNPPKTADQESFYNFGINRGGATFPGPFPGKPLIAFDSVVVVGVTQAGTSGFVTTPEGGTVPLPDGSIQVKTDAVVVTVPLGLLPSTGATLDQYRVNFYPSATSPLTSFNDIASFVPDGHTFRVAAPQGLANPGTPRILD